MIKELKIFLGIFVVLAASRFIPHPPNFTSLIALSFYVPVFFGLRFIPLVVLSFVITDIYIGYHNTLFFTWGSVVVVGLISKYLFSSIIKRLSGAFLGAVLFFLITNFGVWTTGMYDYSFQGLINSYIMGLPFFGYTLISTLVFSSIIETLYKISKVSIKQIF